jgi:predicted alpha/beta-hydrolase family hydrolase
LKAHVIISHGLESSPDATKATALSQVVDAMGGTSERPDYRDCDNASGTSRLGDVHGRIVRLLDLAKRVEGPLILAGSSMGAFISARVSLEVPVLGLFLMAPPTQLEGFDIKLEAADVPTCIVHGWDDELIPASEVVKWAQARRHQLVLVNDSHRLAEHVEFCAEVFARFVRSLSSGLK